MEKIRLWHRRWFLPLNAVLVLTMVGVWWYTCLSPMAQLKASGAPTTLAEIVAEPIPDEENTAAGLRDLQAELGEPMNSVSTFLGELESGTIPPDRLDDVVDLAEPRKETLESLIESIDRPEYASLLKIDDLNVGRLIDAADLPRQAARLLSFATQLALTEGRFADAAELNLGLLRLAKRLEREPSILHRQVATTVQTIALRDAAVIAVSPKLTEDFADRLDSALAAIEDRSSLKWALESERVIALENLNRMPFPMAFLQRGSVLKVFEKAIRLADTPVDQLAAAGKEVTVGAGTFGGVLAQSIESLFESEARVGLEARELRESLRRE